MADSVRLRPVVLKVAAGLGLVNLAFYVAAVLREDTGTGPLWAWATVMVAPPILLWFADRWGGRTSALIAAGLYFLLGVISPPFFAVVYLIGVFACLVGSGGWGRDRSRVE